MNSAYEIAAEIRQNFDQCLSKSLKNCHAFGVHSVMLNPCADGKLRRIFVARDWHQLWKNKLHREQPFYDLSVGIHPHHCDIRITGLKGTMFNHRFSLFNVKNNGRSYYWKKYEYVSPIVTPHGSFNCAGGDYLSAAEPEAIEPGVSIDMKASDMHTVYVEPRKQSAWLIEEGEEDPDFKAICYSNDRLEFFNFYGMYLAMSPETLLSIVDFLEG